MFDLLKDPEAAADITAMPLDYYDVDAAVLYNDLSTPYFAAGFDLEMREGRGPRRAQPDRAAGGRRPADAVRPAAGAGLQPRPDPAAGEAARRAGARLRRARRSRCAPTSSPAALPRPGGAEDVHVERDGGVEPAGRLLGRAHGGVRIAQHEAGAGAVQVFDSWAGALSPETTRSSCSRTCARSSSAWRRRACRASTSSTATPRCCRSSRGRAATPSAWTGACPSTRRGS
jgi:uroporphyrinogen decarboxylase